MPPRIVVEPLPALRDALAALVEGQCRHALARRGRFSLALTGGSAARQLYPRLAELILDWSRIDVFWGDERAVPPGDPESNHALAQALWLARVKVPPERVHRMEGEAPDLEAAAWRYARTLQDVLGTPSRLDLVFLGVGPDGHVCSLFPGHPLLQEERRLVAAVYDSPKPPPQRPTLTLPALAAARQLVILALGQEKAQAVRAGLADAGPPANPLALAVRRAADVVALLDPEAASAI
jgi:6-phosphogluconolactonase